MRRLGTRDPVAERDMRNAIKAYTGPVRRFPPGEGRGHEVKYPYDPRPKKPARPGTAPGNGRGPRQAGPR
jgi:hypothetical protein